MTSPSPAKNALNHSTGLNVSAHKIIYAANTTLKSTN